MSNSTQNKDTQRLAQEVKELGREIRKLTNVLEIAMAPSELTVTADGIQLTPHMPESMEISMTAQAAVATLREICKDAEECSGQCCPIFYWCQVHLPDENAALPPKYWQVPE